MRIRPVLDTKRLQNPEAALRLAETHLQLAHPLAKPLVLRQKPRAPLDHGLKIREPRHKIARERRAHRNPIALTYYSSPS